MGSPTNAQLDIAPSAARVGSRVPASEIILYPAGCNMLMNCLPTGTGLARAPLLGY